MTMNAQTRGQVLAQTFWSELEKISATGLEVGLDEAVPSIAGTYLGYRTGRAAAKHTAATLAPKGRKTRAEDIAYRAAIPTTVLGALAAMYAYRGKPSAKFKGMLLRNFKKLTPAEAELLRQLSHVGVGAGGGTAAGLATGGVVGGVAKLRGSPYKTKKAAAEPSADDADPGMMEQQQAPAEESEEPPAHGVVGANIDLIDKKKAIGFPVIQPPPGMVFRPDLQAFVPDPMQPGWMTEIQAQAAQNNRNYFDAGQQFSLEQQAQAGLDQQVDEQSQAMQDQAAMDQQYQGMQMQADQKAMDHASKKQMMGEPVPAPGAGPALTPKSVAGEPKPKPKKKKPAGGKPDKSSIRINIGR